MGKVVDDSIFLSEINMFMFGRWISTQYDSETLNTANGLWWVEQIKYFEDTVLPNYFDNGSFENTAKFIKDNMGYEETTDDPMRTELLNLLEKCTEQQQNKFRRMYNKVNHSNDDVVCGLTSEQVKSVIRVVQRTVDNNETFYRQYD